MLDVLLESKAPHTRRIGGTLASTLVHGAIITGAVLLTVQEHHGIVREPPPEALGPYVVVQPPEPQTTDRPPASPRTPESPSLPTTPFPPIDQVTTTIQTTDPGPTVIMPDNLTAGPASSPTNMVGGPPGTGAAAASTEAMDVRLVEKPPRVLRSENPRFPEALRARGQNGRIVVQFVVDTLGRAEMSEFKVVDATDAQLADAVRAVLPRFRFTPGEAAGRKVRTMVALPFDFTLVR
jgi:periplasmic protein TonB